MPHKRIAEEENMADNHARIVQLEAQVAALLDAQRRPRHRLPRRFLPLALVALLVLLTPLSLLAAAPFNDLTGGVHDANIGLLYDVGITKGCVPNVSYCPTANVTREEMASFLARTAGLGGNPAVVNAATLQGYAANGLVRANGFGEATTNPGVGITLQPLGTDIAAGPMATLGSTAILAPAPGYVIVRATTTLNAPTGTIVAVRLRHNINASGPVSPFFRATVPAGPYGWVTLSPGAMFPVTAGYQTFTIQATATGDPSTGGYATATDVTLDALFVPFNGLGEPGATTAP